MKGIVIGILAAAAFALYVAAACIPFYTQPQLSKEQEAQIRAEDFYGEAYQGEHAGILSENGEALEERVRLIANAKERIILSTFDMMSDNSGKILMAALLDAAERGVKVEVLMDGFPYFAHAWGNPYFLALAGAENVEFRVYNPVNLLKPWKLMARMHDKYLIADEDVYILGGRNCYDYFLGDHDGYKNYDWDVLVLTKAGASLDALISYFTSVWESGDCVTVGKSAFWSHNPSVEKAAGELAALYEEIEANHPGWLKEADYEQMTVPVRSISLVSNPVHTGVKEPVVYYTVTELLSQPGEQAFFHTPYIMCSSWMMERLSQVCEKNPNITMMTNSVANNGNPFGAADYYVHREEILETGLQVLEYDSGVSYHGKCFTVGDRLSGVGSFNWDMRSVYIDTELMLVIDGEALNRQLREAMSRYEAEAFLIQDGEGVRADGAKMQEMDKKQELRVRLLAPAAKWFRFIM